MKGIFISYRREDSAPYAGRICDHLRRTFPSTSVFMDVDAVTPGADFVNAIDANLGESGVVLVVIGPQWESIKGADGQRRIDSPDDYVVREIAAAMSQSNVIPLLVGGARMPSAARLPAALEALARRNAMEISDARFAADAERLCATIARILDIPQDDQRPSQRVEYGEFFSDAALAKARRRFRLAVWVSYALSALLILFAQIGADREVHSTESPWRLNLPCEDAATDRDRAPCHLVNWIYAELADGETLNKVTTIAGITLGVLLFAFGALVNVKVLRGKNWARIAFVALGGFVIFSLFGVVLSNQLHAVLYVAQLVLYVAAVIVFVWAVRMMYTEPVRRWFLRAY